MNPVILLIGAGRVGLNLALHFRRKGCRVALVVEPSVERQSIVSSALSDVATSASLPTRLPDDITHCVIAVGDGCTSSVADALASIDGIQPGLIVFHTSGSLHADLLAPLSARGCVTGSLHPMQSFPLQALAPERLDGIGCGIEGSDAFWDAASALASTLDWKPLRIAADRKALYHAANVFAGNFPVALAHAAEQLLRASAIDDTSASLGHLLPMLRTVVDRLEALPPSQSLTGPAARGDRETIARHLAALETIDPKLRAAYAALTEWLMADDL